MTDSRRPRLSQMNASRNAQKSVPFVGFFPDLLGMGSIQEVGRQTVRALLEIPIQKCWSPALLGFNDSPRVHEFSAGEHKFTFRGYGRSKLRFIFSVLQNTRKNRASFSPPILISHLSPSG
jgi:hypothetical protein